MVNDTLRTVVQHKRRCSKSGKRKEGSVYLVTELGDGEIPPIVEIIPARPFVPPEGKEVFFRGIIQVDLDAILDWKEYDEYVIGSTKQRRQREKIAAPEEAIYGMPLSRRLGLGICAADGLEAISQLVPLSIRGLGRHLRHLAKTSPDKEVSKAISAYMSHDWPLVLAALWRGWRRYTKEKRARVYANVAAAMIAVGASEDALALKL